MDFRGLYGCLASSAIRDLIINEDNEDGTNFKGPYLAILGIMISTIYGEIHLSAWKHGCPC
jgi:hypothetical protein